MSIWEKLTNLVLVGNPLLYWLLAAIIFVAVVTGMRIFQAIILKRVQKFVGGYRLRGPIYILTALQSTNAFLICIIGLRVGSMVLELPPRAEKILDGAAIIAVMLQFGLWLNTLYVAWYVDYREAHVRDNATAVTTLDATRILIRLFIWICVLLLILNNLGFNVSALITGLGVGGVAIALAVQQILGDILASLAIATDKPFAVGDFIVLGDHMGSVEHIGLKTTRIRSLSGEQIIFANSDLLTSRVRNYGRMYERRLEVNLTLAYDTPRDKLELVPSMIKATILAQPDLRFDRAHFLAFGPAGLNIQYVYFVLSPDNNLYMDRQQAINLELISRLSTEGIAFAANPTNTIHVQVKRPIAPQPAAAPTPPQPVSAKPATA